MMNQEKNNKNIAVSDQRDPLGTEAWKRNMEDGSLMQQLACLRWYYSVLSKIPLDVCPLHCNLPIFSIEKERVCTYCAEKMAQNKWLLCYFGKPSACEKSDNAPQFKCSCGKMVNEVMPMPCGSTDPQHWRAEIIKNRDYFISLNKKMESMLVSALVANTDFYRHPASLSTQTFEYMPAAPAEDIGDMPGLDDSSDKKKEGND